MKPSLFHAAMITSSITGKTFNFSATTNNGSIDIETDVKSNELAARIHQTLIFFEAVVEAAQMNNLARGPVVQVSVNRINGSGKGSYLVQSNGLERKFEFDINDQKSMIEATTGLMWSLSNFVSGHHRVEVITGTFHNLFAHAFKNDDVRSEMSSVFHQAGIQLYDLATD